MSETKLDRRRAYSINQIREAFLELLKKKTLEEITIGELCEKADVNRSTFYRNYTDIYALMESLVDECFQDLFVDPVAKAGLSGDFEASGYQFILEVCKTTEKKKSLYQQMLYGKASTTLSEKLTDAMFALYHDAHVRASGLRPSEETVLYYRYLASGMIGMWMQWLKDDCRIPKEKVASACKGLISSFFAELERHFGH